MERNFSNIRCLSCCRIGRTFLLRVAFILYDTGQRKTMIHLPARVKLLVHCLQALAVHVSVYLSGGNIGMAQQFLNHP